MENPNYRSLTFAERYGVEPISYFKNAPNTLFCKPRIAKPLNSGLTLVNESNFAKKFRPGGRTNTPTIAEAQNIINASNKKINYAVPVAVILFAAIVGITVVVLVGRKNKKLNDKKAAK
jgi:hypothetical protein